MALIMALLAVLVLSAIGMTLMFSSDTETKVNANYRDTQAAYFAAKAGLEEARDRMRSDAGAGISISGSLPTTAPGTAAGVLYITNPTGSESVQPWVATNAYYDDEICKELSTSSCSGGLPSTSGWYSSVSANSAYAANPVLPYKWMRINLKLNRSAYGSSHVMYVDGGASSTTYNYYVCRSGSNETVSSTACPGSTAVYLLTALAVAPNGSRRMVQYELAKNAINLTLPGALTIDGPIAAGANTICGSGATCNSGGDFISGNEPDPTAVPSHASSCAIASTVPAIATADATSNSNLVTAINSNKTNMVGSGGTPSVVNVASALTNLSTPAQIEALVSQLTAAAGTNVGSDCSSLNLGTSASPTITVVTNSGGSSCNLNSGTTGYGILVVTGSLQYVNVNSYQGIILMLGTAQFVSSSSKDTTMNGALFMAQDRDPSTGALLSSLGTPTFNFHHGSTDKSDPSIQWNQCIINSVSSLATTTNYKILAVREMMY